MPRTPIISHTGTDPRPRLTTAGVPRSGAAHVVIWAGRLAGHVKQAAKRSGRVRPRRGPGRFVSGARQNQTWRPRTRLIHGGSQRSHFGEMSEALFLTSGFRYAARRGRRRPLRRPGCRATPIHASPTRPCACRGAPRAARGRRGGGRHGDRHGRGARRADEPAAPGDRVVAARLLFGSCHYILTEILPRFGVEVVLVDGADLAAWAAALCTSGAPGAVRNAGAIRRSSWSTSPRSRSWRTAPAPR